MPKLIPTLKLTNSITDTIIDANTDTKLKSHHHEWIGFPKLTLTPSFKNIRGFHALSCLTDRFCWGRSKILKEGLGEEQLYSKQDRAVFFHHRRLGVPNSVPHATFQRFVGTLISQMLKNLI